MSRPERLPPYTYVPGRVPHPLSHADGHMVDAPQSAADVDHYEHGRLLFDAGYYWEAHEAWEHRWIELGRRGAAADAMKGFIKLAAAGVKVFVGQQEGAVRHATRSRELLQATMTAVVRTDDFSEDQQRDPQEGGLEGQLENQLEDRQNDHRAAIQIAERYLVRPFTHADCDPWQPMPLAGWQLRSG